MAKRVDVDNIARSLTAKQFINWEAYARLEPFGEKRADWRAAQIVKMIFDMAVVAKDRKYKLEDFLLKFEEDFKEKPVQDQFAMMKILAAAYAAPVDEKVDDTEATQEMKDLVNRARAAMKES